MIFTYQSSAYWGGGAGGRILDRERDGKEGKIRHQYTVYVLTCGLRGNRR